MYAAPAWWGFSTSTDRNRIAGFVNRGARSGFCAADHTEYGHSEMVNDAEDKLFHKILYDASHVLSMLLPERRSELTYSLRTRRHDRTLTTSHSTH